MQQYRLQDLAGVTSCVCRRLPKSSSCHVPPFYYL